MNLETFKARARRKLALPARTRPTPIATPLMEPETTTPATALVNTTPAAPVGVAFAPEPMNPETAQQDRGLPASPKPDSPSLGENRFARAMRQAAGTDGDTNPISEAPQHSEVDNRDDTRDIERSSGDDSDTQLARLRSLLLGSEYQSKQDHAEAVYQRTQANLNTLGREMDTRLTTLSEQVAKLEDSLSTKFEVHSGDLSAKHAQLLTNHEERIDALDARLTELLETARSELGERRATNRDQLETKLAAITEHSERQLQTVSQRLEASIADMQSQISAQLSYQSSTTATGSENHLVALRTQLETVIDERIRSVYEEQALGMRKLSDVMLAHTDSIKTELQAQTLAQKTLLATHRHEIESQFNGALSTLNDNKVSHQEMSRLLARLADRIQRL